MFKMIVVDDEYLVRLGIKETIDWNDYDIEIVGEASNGETGLELAKSLQPDIIITDIKMPVMDGLDLVKQLQQHQLDCIVIILSGYKDFEYAKDTLENGAYSYLLKPIDNDELIDKVKDAISFLQEKRKKDHFISHLKEDIPTIKQTLLSNILEGNDLNISKIKQKLSLYNINISPKGTLIYVKMDESNHKNEHLDDIHSLYKQLLHLFHHEDELVVSKFDNYCFTILNGLSSEDSEIICEQALKTYEKKHQTIVSIGIKSYDSLETIRDAFKYVKQVTREKLFPMINTISHSENKYSQPIKQAMQYIAQNYSRNITVKMVADSLFVSESYLMHLFKAQLNKTFNECLTDYRMMIAKQLLLSQKLKVYEIAELVGYNDSKYFSQIFRKKVGMSPSQYIEDEVIK